MVISGKPGSNFSMFTLQCKANNGGEKKKRLIFSQNSEGFISLIESLSFRNFLWKPKGSLKNKQTKKTTGL